MINLCELVLKWFNSNLLNQYEYEMTNIIEFISHTISSSSHQFVINFKDKNIGLFGYSIINNEASFNFDVYDLNILEDDEDFIIRSAIDYIDSYKDVVLISSIVLANDYKKLGLLFNNGFEISQTSYLPVSEKGYKKTYVLKRSI